MPNRAQIRADASQISGTVLLPDGHPASGIAVFLCTPQKGLCLHNGQPDLKGSTRLHVQTDADGRFSFPAQTVAFAIAAVGDAGYGQVSQSQFEQTGPVRLQSWARIEGTLRTGSKPAVGESIVAYVEGDYGGRNKPEIERDYEVTTETFGRFVMERVVPADVIVAHRIENALAHNALIFAEPGKTYQVSLGGTGRPVIGRIAVPEEAASKTEWKNCWADVSVVLPGLPMPEAIKAKGLSAMRDWQEAWQRTPEGMAHRLADRRYAFKFGNDGSFRIEDLPAGMYHLSCELRGRKDKDELETIGRAAHDFEIAEMPGGRSHEPLDLGQIEPEMLNRIDVGSVAAPFEVTTFDGKTIKSSDYRGRYMLLTFWSVKWWDNTKETGNLKAVYQQFGKDGPLAMISFNIDDKPDEARKHIEQNDLRWPQAYLGSLDKTLLPRAYGAYRFPAIVLVSPDGKILAMGLRGPKIAEAVEKALAGQTPAASGPALESVRQ